MDAISGFRHQSFRLGEVIFEEGQTGDAAYLIIKGKVEIRIGTQTENPRTLAVLGKGQVIGELAMFDDHMHVASAVAVEPTTTSAISRDEFQNRVNQMDPVIRGIILQMVERARQVVAELRVGTQEVDWGNWKRR